jgi:hypothetical protein
MVETVDAGNKKVSRRVVINAPASEIFALVVNPHRHHELDGSGTVGANISGPERLATGEKFSTHMKQFGMKYRTTSTATVVEEDRVVEWQVRALQKWRWELEPFGANQTQVTETWDMSDIPFWRVYRLVGMHNRNAKGIEETLRRLQKRFEG